MSVDEALEGVSPELADSVRAFLEGEQFNKEMREAFADADTDNVSETQNRKT